MHYAGHSRKCINSTLKSLILQKTEHLIWVTECLQFPEGVQPWTLSVTSELCVLSSDGRRIEYTLSGLACKWYMKQCFFVLPLTGLFLLPLNSTAAGSTASPTPLHKGSSRSQLKLATYGGFCKAQDMWRSCSKAANTSYCWEWECRDKSGPSSLSLCGFRGNCLSPNLT